MLNVSAPSGLSYQVFFLFVVICLRLRRSKTFLMMNYQALLVIITSRFTGIWCVRKAEQKGNRKSEK